MSTEANSTIAITITGNNQGCNVDEDIDTTTTTTTTEKKTLDLETQIKVLQRKLENSKQIISATEDFARLAQARETNAVSTNRRTRERLDEIEAQVQMKRLEKACSRLNDEIEAKEKYVDEIGYNDCLNLNLPIHTDQRRNLKVLKEDIGESRKLRDGQLRLLTNLESRQNLLEDMRNAAAQGDLDSVNSLLKLGVSVNIADDEGRGVCAFKYACGQGHLNVVKAMIDVADVNNIEGRLSPLHFAVRHNRVHVVDFLLQKNAKCNELDETGDSPLHVSCRKGYLDILNLLMDAGANVDEVNRNGDSCLHICASARFKVDNEDNYNDNDGDDDDDTDALILYNNQAEMASRLLEMGASDEIKNLDDLTPFIVAKTQRMYGVLQILNEARMAKSETL